MPATFSKEFALILVPVFGKSQFFCPDCPEKSVDNVGVVRYYSVRQTEGALKRWS